MKFFQLGVAAPSDHQGVSKKGFQNILKIQCEIYFFAYKYNFQGSKNLIQFFQAVIRPTNCFDLFKWVWSTTPSCAQSTNELGMLQERVKE